MKAPEPRFVGVGKTADGTLKLTIIAGDFTVQELTLTLEIASKLAEDFLLATMDLAAAGRSTQLCNSEPDLFEKVDNAAEAGHVPNNFHRNSPRR